MEKFDYEGLKKILEQLSDFQRSANTRVIEGLNPEDIKSVGEQLVLQDGCIDFFQSITKNGNLNSNVHVLSNSWSGDLIRSTFSSGTTFIYELINSYYLFSPIGRLNG